MNSNHCSGLLVFGFNLLLAGPVLADGENSTTRPGAAEFEEASIIVEQNVTDGDTEVVIFAKGLDDGLRSLRVVAPDGRVVGRFRTNDPSTLGIREFALESPEPAGDAILAAYPEGEYRFVGRTFEGLRLTATAELSHQSPAGPVITAPAADADDVSPTMLVIEWSAVPDAVVYIVELTNETLEIELSAQVPGDSTSFQAPGGGYVMADSDYSVGVAAINAFGNVSGTEIEFATGAE